MKYSDHRIEEEISHRAAEFLNRESNRTSLITVTRTLLSKDGRHADILITVFPEEKDKEALDFLKRLRGDLRAHLRKETKLARLPFLDFKIDLGEKNRQRLDEISNK